MNSSNPKRRTIDHDSPDFYQTLNKICYCTIKLFCYNSKTNRNFLAGSLNGEKNSYKIKFTCREATLPLLAALGQHGLPIMDFVRAYTKTKDQKGQVIPAVITVYVDKTFTFITKLPPVAELIKRIKLNTAPKLKRETVGTLTTPSQKNCQ